MRAFTLAVFVVLVGCGGGEATSPTSPPSQRALRVTLGRNSDTIGAHLAGALQVSVTDGASHAVPLAAVTFAVLRNTQFPEPGIRLNVLGDTLVTASTASNGAATLDVDLGKYAGTFAVVVTAQGVARPDTETFTVQPGAVASIRIPTHDTLVTIGTTYKPLIFVADRAGNPPLNPPTLTSARPVCPLTGATVTPSDIARCVITVRAGAVVDSITVNAIPKIPITAIVGNASGRVIATMNLDGSGLKLIRNVNVSTFDDFHPALGPNGLIASMDVGNDGKTHVETIDASGTVRFIPVDLPNGAEENWPVFSRDGQWLYFSACNWPYYEHCRVWQTKPDGSQPKALTPLSGSSGQRSNFGVVSPDGRMLAYSGYGERMHTLNLQTGVDVDLGFFSQVFDIDSTGTKLAYVKDNFSSSPMFISNIDGSNPIALVGGRNFSTSAQWLPGGQWILSRAVISDSPNNGGDRVLVNVTTGEMVPIRFSTSVSEIYLVR